MKFKLLYELFEFLWITRNRELSELEKDFVFELISAIDSLNKSRG